MSLFDTIKNAIFSHAAAATAPQTSAPPAPGSAASEANLPALDRKTGMIAPPPANTSLPAEPQPVDIAAVLNGMAAKSGQKLNWQTSIVDLMKAVGLDSSLQNRIKLAEELGYTGDKGDSATLNVWLHRQVMTKLEENGGKLPPQLRS
jgi:hypothetical protein